MQNPKIIDVTALERNRQRALAMGKEGADFLVAFAADDMALRLSTIMRTFESVISLNIPGDHLEKVIAAAMPEADHQTKRSAAYHGRFGGECLASDEDLALQAENADLILSPLALQFTNDLPGALIQIRRALKPDGLFLGAMVGGDTLKELRQSILEAEVEITGSAHARVLPFVDVRDAGGLLQRAGFALPVTDSDTLTVRYDTLFALMHDLRAMGATNCLVARAQSFTRRDVMVRAAEIYQERFSDGDGRVRATFEIISLSGWAPHESQQKPLKPGTAKVKLEDALKTTRDKDLEQGK